MIDISKSLTHHGRKERVNMSTEQIEKWLNESSLAKEESKVEMETLSKYDSTATSTPEKPKVDPAAAPPPPTPPQTTVVVPAAAPLPSTPTTTMPASHLSISPKIQHLVRPVNVTLSKLSDRLKRVATSMGNGKPQSVFHSSGTGLHQPVSPVKPRSPVAARLTTPAKVQAAAATAAVPVVLAEPDKRKEMPGTPPGRKMSKDSSFGEDHGS